MRKERRVARVYFWTQLRNLLLLLLLRHHGNQAHSWGGLPAGERLAEGAGAARAGRSAPSLSVGICSVGRATGRGQDRTGLPREQVAGRVSAVREGTGRGASWSLWSPSFGQAGEPWSPTAHQRWPVPLPKLVASPPSVSAQKHPGEPGWRRHDEGARVWWPPVAGPLSGGSCGHPTAQPPPPAKVLGLCCLQNSVKAEERMGRRDSLVSVSCGCCDNDHKFA